MSHKVDCNFTAAMEQGVEPIKNTLKDWNN